MLGSMRDRILGMQARLLPVLDVTAGLAVAHPVVADVDLPTRAAWAAPAEGPRPASVREAVHWTVLYSGIFDYPLTLDEIHRYLLAPGGAPAEVERAVGDLIAHGDLETDGTFVFPAGRAETAATRLRRGRHAHHVWKRARAYARLIWMLPYVRMVAVTGALAMDNVEDGDDIDFLVVATPGRLWLARGMILVLVKLARLRGDTICPNFILSTRALRLQQRDVYTAHELAQMIPLHGGPTAERLLAENDWYRDVLPNVPHNDGPSTDDRLPRLLLASKALGQALLDLPPGSAIERWERRRKIRKLSRGTPSHEALYTADMCKGHADGHGSRIMDRWLAEVARRRRPES